MKSTFRRIAFLAIGLAALTSAEAFADDWQVIYQRSIIAPSGASYSQDILFAIEEPITAIRVELVDDRGTCGARTSSINVTHNSDMRFYETYYPNAEGVFEFGHPGLEWVVFQNENPRLLNAYCRRIVYARTGDVEPPPSQDFEFAGAVTFDGGFRNRIEIPVDTNLKVDALWVRLPEFCGDVNVLDAGTITEGVYESAVLVDDETLVYEVNGGSGSRISAIALTLNGPRDADCDIPVYVRTVE